MKPLSERDENFHRLSGLQTWYLLGRNEATLWKRWEPGIVSKVLPYLGLPVGMKPLSERDENNPTLRPGRVKLLLVGMKPLSERDENRDWPNEPVTGIVTK